MERSFAVGWRQVGACLVLLAVTAMITSSYSVIAVPLAKEFHPSRMWLMFAMTVLSGVSALISPSVGKLLDRVSLQKAMALGGVLLALGFVAISFAQSFNHVLIVYGLLVAPANLLIGPLACTVLLTRWFAKRRGTALGVAIAGISVGGVIFPPVMQYLLENLEWRMGLRALALIVLAITLLTTAFIVNYPADRGLNPDGAAVDAEASLAANKVRTIPATTLLRDPTFWMIAVLVATVTAGLKGMVTNLVSLATDVGIAAGSAAFLISIYASSGFVAKLGFAVMADRMNPRLMMAVSLIGYALGCVAMIWADAGYTAIATGVALMGFFGGMMIPMESFLIPRIWGREVVGRVGGMLNLLIMSFLLISPPLFGRIYDVTGSYDVIFGLFAGLAVMMLLLVPIVRLGAAKPAEPVTPVA
ncbi:MFS transporter [Novosphingobium sp. MW5]|nr:MFS transporter [Novosphingobium sp. MW5]